MAPTPLPGAKVRPKKVDPRYGIQPVGAGPRVTTQARPIVGGVGKPATAAGSVGTAIQAGPKPDVVAQVKAFNPQQQALFRKYIGAANGYVAPPQLSVAELAQYGARRNAANLQYNQGLSKLAANRGALTQRYASSERDLATQFGRQREQVPYAALARGVLTSGIYGGQLQDVAQQRVKALGQLLQQRTAGLNDISLQQANLQQTRAQLLADITAQEAARRQQLAAQIRSVK